MPKRFEGQIIWWFSESSRLGPPKPRRDHPKARILGQAFARHGSDKSNQHDYHRPYAAVLDSVPPGALLEIGIGSQNSALAANMVGRGRIGASLRTWRALGHFPVVHGADLDPKTMFYEPGIQTHIVDQTDSASLNLLRATLSDAHPDGLSLIIDDGLHDHRINQGTLEHLFDLLNPLGIYVIEDLHRSRLPSMIAFAQERELGWAIWSNSVFGPDNCWMAFNSKMGGRDSV